MNRPRWPPAVVSRKDLLARGAGIVGEREHLVGWRDVVGGAREQVQRAVDPAQVDALAADLQLAGDQLVVAEQVLDDPEVERAGNRLGVLEPVLELAVALDVGGVVDVGEQLQLTGDLVVGLDRDEAGEHVLAAQHATSGRDEPAVEGEVSPGRERLERCVDDRLAGMEVDRRAGDRQRVDPLGSQRGVDRREPAALTVADQVHRTADVIDRAVDHVEVVVDRRVLGARGRADPVERVRALESRREDRAHLTLGRRVVDDARVVASLRRQHERRRAPGFAPEFEKSRSRATGASNTTSFGELQSGRRRSVATLNHRNQSASNSGGVSPRRSAPAHQSARPSTVAAHAAMPSASAISSNDGGHVPVMRLLSVTAQMQPCSRPRVQLAGAS